MSTIASGRVFKQGVTVDWWTEWQEVDLPGELEVVEAAFEAAVYAEWWAEAIAAMDSALAAEACGGER